MDGDGSISWTVDVATAKSYTLRIGYYLPFDEKTQYLSVNGVVTDTIVFTPPTGQWKTLDRLVNLHAGSNTIEILHYWGYMWFDYIEVRGNGQTSVTSTELEHETPLAFDLAQNHPNPFNPSTQIRFTLPEASPVRVEVFNVTGERVALLDDGIRAAGTHEIMFDASHLASGVYLYRLVAPGFVKTRKMVLLK